MVKNKKIYLSRKEYEKIQYKINNEKILNRVVNIVINRKFDNIEFVNFLFNELNIKRTVSKELDRYSALYDILRDIPGDLNKNVSSINLIVEDENYISSTMIKVLAALQNYFSNEIISCGTVNDFPLSFDIFVVKSERDSKMNIFWKYITNLLINGLNIIMKR